MVRFWLITTLLLSGSVAAQDTVWQDVAQTNNAQARATANSTGDSPLQEYRALTLEEETFRSMLNIAASSGVTGAQARMVSSTVNLPLPDGSFANVTVTPNETLSPEVAATHPEIQTWNVTGTDGKVLNGVIDMTTQGFHAMLAMPNGDTIFIDPQETAAARQYASFSKRANAEAFRKDWTCGTHGGASFRPDLTAARNTAARAGETLRTYRLAVAATGEYTAANGGTAASGLAAITTTINRVNLTYNRDLSVQLQLVSGTSIVYTDAATDPYTNTSPSSMITENQANLDNVIGSSNYDIGHVFGTSGGGLAYVGVICNSTYKARGMTGLTTPSGTTFDIDYVAHEIGHQFGATHTFNSTAGSCNGNREPTTAYEPGSGSTIMSYSGICSSDNLQTDSDDMFHAASISQVEAYAHTSGGGGMVCGTAGATNINPTVNAGADYTIPARTPFILTGSGSTTSGTLTYSWEQLDTGTASTVGVDTGNNAIIRAYLPSASSVRTIPRMSGLTTGVQAVGETLPSTSRTLNFRLTARNGTGSAFDDMRITTSNTGSAFAVTAPAGTSLVAGAATTVTWNVAGTDQAPISCSNVDIALTTDNGASFTTLLTAPNTGSAIVTLPGTLGVTNRIRVKCSNNIFFALSASNPSVATSDVTTTTTTSSGGGGGGGSVPIELLLSAGIYALFRWKKGDSQ